MITFAETRVSKDELALFKRIEKIVSCLSDIDLGEDEKGKKIILSCHILARAVSQVFGVKFVDGFYYPNFEHTWLVTSSGNVIDLYPVATIGGPIMVVEPDYHSPAYWLYHKKRLNKNFHSNSFRRAVRKVVAAIHNTPCL